MVLGVLEYPAQVETSIPKRIRSEASFCQVFARNARSLQAARFCAAAIVGHHSESEEQPECVSERGTPTWTVHRRQALTKAIRRVAAYAAPAAGVCARAYRYQGTGTRTYRCQWQ